MKTVWKFELDFAQGTSVQVSAGAKIVHMAMQDGAPHLWIELDAHKHFGYARNFAVYGTGHAVPDTAAHVGSVVDAPFVWHVYELREV